ncbi:hypothetical protein [Actinacidiphila oryziradicis]|uniref:hypothetical protein n=1 Tax=Actinacidiphila oryziradicis TaxID=2571141 RepID=UPI0023F02143|nr:hypothetical protein [Actinacidiphila oryziradicis]
MVFITNGPYCTTDGLTAEDQNLQVGRAAVLLPRGGEAQHITRTVESRPAGTDGLRLGPGTERE